MRILFATSEVQPLAREGGLAEVSVSLPRALQELGHDVRLILPAYPSALKAARRPRPVSGPLAAGPDGRLWSALLPESDVPVFLVEIPDLFERDGGLYTDADGDQWADNAQRFAAFCRLTAAVALGRAGLDWQPEVVHANDWQTGLIPALLHLRGRHAPGTLFTIHNLASQGLFSWDTFHRLGLPRPLWSRHGLEHYGNFSFIKGGLAFADRINTVSPTYAREIQDPELGCGMEHVLQRHSARLAGVLNGIDYRVWDPQRDPLIPSNYDARRLQNRVPNKRLLQARVGLPQRPDLPLLAYAGRLLPRRGCDLLLDLVPSLERLDCQLLILGHGDRGLEEAWRRAAAGRPSRLAVFTEGGESMQHLMAAGADLLLAPSRFEPCGLEQLHGQRYGQVPLGHRTGGLADSIRDPGDGPRQRAGVSGFLFDRMSLGSLLGCLEEALRVFRQEPARWTTLMRNGMGRDFSWTRSARSYTALYQEAIDHRMHRPDRSPAQESEA